MKRIIYNTDGTNIAIESLNDYCHNFKFVKNYIENGIIIKQLQFYIWDDISFNAYIANINNNDSVEFEFDQNDKIYNAVDEFLADDNEFIIDDDNTRDTYKKYLIFKRCENKIILKFVNRNINTECFVYNRFSVFIKNIGPDCRSKITDYDRKARIVDFLRNVEETLFNKKNKVKKLGIQ